MSDSRLEIILAAKDLTAKTLKTFQGRIGAITRSVFSLHGGLATLAGVGGFGSLAKGVLDTASSFEQMEVKLDALTKGKGRETLESINQWAKDMPVNTMAAVDTFAMMQALGLDPTIDKMQTLVNVSAIFGDHAMPRVARALGQMQTLGKLSAEELNQLSEAGINARKYLTEAFGKPVEELQKSKVSIDRIIDAIWDGLNADYNGAAKAAMGSWRGIVTQFQSNWMELERTVAGAGLFDELKTQMAGVNSEFTTWLNINQSLIKAKIPDYIDNTKDAAARLFSTMQTGVGIYQSLPDEIVGAAGAGIAGRIIFGSWGPAKIVAALSIINDGMGSLNMGMGDMARSYGESVDAIDDFYQALMGNRKGYADDIRNMKLAGAASIRQQQQLPPYITITPGGGGGAPGGGGGATVDPFSGLPNAAPGRLDRLTYPTELGMVGAERGHMAVARMTAGHVAGLEEIEAQTERTYSRMEQLTERTAEKMQDNFSDVFYDAVTGELKSIGDYAEAIFKSIARAWSDMMGQMVAQSIFGADFKGGGGLSSLLSLFGGGSSGTIIGATGTTAFGMAGGGYLGEDVVGIGRRTGSSYELHANEYVVPPSKLAGGGGSTTVNVNITAMDSKDVQRVLSDNKGLIGNLVGGQMMRNQALRTNVKMASR